jgi:hypothetical protein
LLERAAGSGSTVDRSRVERIINQRADSLEWPGRLVIKWLPDPRTAFDYLCRYKLADLLRMEDATLWRQEMFSEMVEQDFDRWYAIHQLAEEAFKPDDGMLMAPKLAAKRNQNANPDVPFNLRAIAAQIGWIETSITRAAVEAIIRLDFLLSQRVLESSKIVQDQLQIFDVYEHGLLATWETSAELICVPRMAT